MNKQIDTLLPHVMLSLQNYFETDLVIDYYLLLSEPERRNRIIRIFLTSHSKSVPKSIILKQSLPEETDADDKDAFSRFARDWAGLKFASQFQEHAHFVPKFFAGNKEHRFILIEDLGQQHISLVDSLTMNDTEKAISALTRFMKALGSFHAASFGHTELYSRILKTINSEAESEQDELSFAFSDLLPKLEEVHKFLDLKISEEIVNEAKALIESVYRLGPFTVLTHGDICPDNVFDHEENRDLQLIDFEWACVRNALLDGTYLRMSMPTCWCAKAIPPKIIGDLERIYREELKLKIPQAHDDITYNKAYIEACGFWILQQTIPFIISTLENDRIGPSGPTPKNSLWKPEDNWVRPRVLSRLQAFVDVAKEHQQLPNLSVMATKMLKLLKESWPTTIMLEYYPAFKQ